MMVNYTNPTQAQMLGAQMMPMDVNEAQSPSVSSPSSNVPQATQQALMQAMQSQQFQPGYTDSAGVSGNTLNYYGIQPGNGGDGLMGLGTSQALGGGGNPLNLSSGYNFSPQDLKALYGAFNG